MTEKPPSSMARYAVWYVLALILLLSIFQYYSRHATGRGDQLQRISPPGPD